MIEPPVENLLTVLQAIAILDAAPVAQRVVQLPLHEVSGHCLADPLYADRDYPPFDKSLMDGFAVRAADTAAPGAVLKIAGTLPAGQSEITAGSKLQPGEAVAIMTGAPVPIGADAVVPVEFTTVSPDVVTINKPVRPGQAIARRGADTPAGAALLPAGQRIGPAQIAVAGTVGATSLRVFDSPRVIVISTGNELVDLSAVPTGAQIRDANGMMLASLLRQLGATVQGVLRVTDDLDQIQAVIQSSASADAVFISGGVSMGQFDFVALAMKNLGCAMEITKLRIKPGKPLVYGRLGDCHIFGLPGNPVSAYVCTVRLAARVLRRMAGAPADQPLRRCTLSTPLPANGPREYYLPAARSGDSVLPLSPAGSADVFTLARANGLIVLPENAPALAAGQRVDVLEL